MPDEFELARGWFRKAESDLNTAQHMLESDGPFDTACFHAQQAAEKYLKGLRHCGESLSTAPTIWKSCNTWEKRFPHGRSPDWI